MEKSNNNLTLSHEVQNGNHFIMALSNFKFELILLITTCRDINYTQLNYSFNSLIQQTICFPLRATQIDIKMYTCVNKKQNKTKKR